jgi:hypothetical protein
VTDANGWHRLFSPPYRTENADVGRLLLKEIFKSCARVKRLRGRSFALDGCSRGKEGAFVPSIFLRQPHGDGLGTLIPAARIKKRALPATVQFCPAIRALPLLVNPDRQQRRAGSTPPDRPLPRHHGSPRAERFGPLLLLHPPAALSAVGVLVTPLFILPAHDETSSLDLEMVLRIRTALIIELLHIQCQQDFGREMKITTQFR